MDFSISAINPFFEAKERAKYWEERGFNFNPQTMTDYEMNDMVSAYEKAHDIVITQK